MPLKGGKANIGANIKELEQHGSRPRSHKQIVAIALDVARRSGAAIPKKRGPKPHKVSVGWE
jgi:hypothetical protein